MQKTGWEPNENGFLRLNGALYSSETSMNIIRLYEHNKHLLANKSMSWKDLAFQAGPSETFCKELCQTFECGDSIAAKPHVSNSEVIFGALHESIYESNPAYIVKDYQDILLMNFDIAASETQICDVLNYELDLTLKLATIDRAEKYTEENEIMATLVRW